MTSLQPPIPRTYNRKMAQGLPRASALALALCCALALGGRSVTAAASTEQEKVGARPGAAREQRVVDGHERGRNARGVGARGRCWRLSAGAPSARGRGRCVAVAVVSVQARRRRADACGAVYHAVNRQTDAAVSAASERGLGLCAGGRHRSHALRAVCGSGHCVGSVLGRVAT